MCNDAFVIFFFIMTIDLKRDYENNFHNYRNLTDTNVCISIKWNGLADGQKPYKVGISQMHRMSPSIRE